MRSMGLLRVQVAFAIDRWFFPKLRKKTFGFAGGRVTRHVVHPANGAPS
jgi:hypothetical protein